MKTIRITALGCLLILASCTKELPVETSITALGYDITKSVVHDVQCSCEELTEAVLGQFTLDDEHRYDGVTVILFEISNISKSDIVQVELPAVRERFLRIQKDRDEEIALFYQRLKQAICDLRQRPPVDGNTFFNRNVGQILNRLARKAANYKSIIVCSDAIESNLWDLKAIVEQSNFKLSEQRKEVLSKELFDDCALENLIGIPIYLMHKAVPETDALINEGHDLMRYHYSKFNANIQSISDVDLIEMKLDLLSSNSTNGAAE